jgi:hypothetical protein
MVAKAGRILLPSSGLTIICSWRCHPKHARFCPVWPCCPEACSPRTCAIMWVPACVCNAQDPAHVSQGRCAVPCRAVPCRAVPCRACRAGAMLGTQTPCMVQDRYLESHRTLRILTDVAAAASLALAANAPCRPLPSPTDFFEEPRGKERIMLIAQDDQQACSQVGRRDRKVDGIQQLMCCSTAVETAYHWQCNAELTAAPAGGV